MTGDEPAGDREAALVEFQTTMQRFLETQENIMLAYFGGEQPARGARPVLQPLARTTTAPRRATPGPGPTWRPSATSQWRGQCRASLRLPPQRQGLPPRQHQSRRADPRLM